jgi:hypothetical protein
MRTLRSRIQLGDLRRRLLAIKPISENPYASHLPILTAVALMRPIRTVLELGSGPFSTSAFLDRQRFPDLEHLVSYEDDPSWAAEVRLAVGGDQRLTYVEVDNIPTQLPERAITEDLVFIDNSKSAKDRARTIAQVRARLSANSLVVVHDCDKWEYRGPLRRFDSHALIDAFTPQTGLAWKDLPDKEARELKTLNRILNSVAPHSFTDTEHWVSLLEREVRNGRW